MLRLLLLGTIIVALGACATPAPTYHWSSAQGKACVATCRSDFYRCQSQCFGAYSCQDSCAHAEWACAEACPDVTVVYAKESK